jgi:hypothetical protein
VLSKGFYSATAVCVTAPVEHIAKLIHNTSIITIITLITIITIITQQQCNNSVPTV